MAEIILNYIQKHYKTNADISLIKKISYEEARKFQPYYEYLEIDKSELIRNKDEPTGLRNIGNTCYLNIFLQLLYHVNQIRDMFIDSHFKEKLLMSIQNLFGRMLFSKYSYCDTEQIFDELNKITLNKIDLGVQFDFHQYLSIQLDNIEKILKRQGLNIKGGIIDKVFCGKYKQTIKAKEEVSVTESKYGMITLDGRLGSFQSAYAAFKKYSIQDYKVKNESVTAEATIDILQFPPLLSFFINRVSIENGNTVKFNGEFKYPKYLQFQKSTNEFIYSLSQQDELLQKKISKVEQIIQKKQYNTVLQSLLTTKKFLQDQTFETVDNASLDLEGVDNYYGIIGSQDSHQQSKIVIDNYIKKLESQQIKLAQTLQKLNLEKKASFEKKKLQKYVLFALMIHMGSAVSGHYYIIIYNQIQKKWRKYSDREVTVISEQEVHNIALGKTDKSTNVCCLIYKHPDFKCNPFQKPTVPASVKSRVNQSDIKTGQIINNLKVQRMVRTCADLAQQQVKYYKQQFPLKKDMFIDYFSEVVNYFIDHKNIKMAELYRLRTLISQPSFQHEVANQLSLKNFQLPPITITISQYYVQTINTIRKALYFQQNNNIQSAIAVLSFHKIVQTSYITFYEQLLIVVLLKSCFYLDLYQQMAKNVKALIQCINNAMGFLKKSIFKDQLSSNIRASVPNADIYLKDPVDIKKLTQFKGNQNVLNSLNIKKVFEERFKTWTQMYLKIKASNKLISQQQRNNQEIIELSKTFK